MIKIEKLSVSIKDKKIIKNIDLIFPHTGLIGISGPSGCGKTTFLNAIAGLVDFNGGIYYNGQNLKNLSAKELDDFRLLNIGFIFQDFKLFESENICQNIMFPQDIISNLPTNRKKRKTDDLLSVVGLNKYINKGLEKLSGGEKQRVAICRALANDPKIVLADEPTGSLDNKNSKQIMDIFQKISCKSLVIVVSHDEELLKEYVDQIIYLKDGSVDKIAYTEKEEKDTFLPISKGVVKSNKFAIKTPFLIRYFKTKYKKNKWRSFLSNLVISIGLLGVGLSLNVNRLISSNIKESYTAIVDDSKIMAEPRKIRHEMKYKGFSSENIDTLINDEDLFLKSSGIYYLNNFEDMFPNGNNALVNYGATQYVLEGLTARHINEFAFLDECKETIYPNSKETLKDDEIIVGLTGPMIFEICHYLRLEKTLTALSDYLLKHDIDLCFDFCNYAWDYSDQQLFKIKGFVLSQDSLIYHSNHYWNEVVFEEMMMLPSTDELLNTKLAPWTLKKTSFVTSKDPEKTLKCAISNTIYSNLVFEFSSMEYYPFLYRRIKSDDKNRFIIFEMSNVQMSSSYSDLILSSMQCLSNPIYGSNKGYSIFPKNMMMGFACPTYFSLSKDALTRIEDDFSVMDFETCYDSFLPEGVMMGHYSKSFKTGVIFENIPQSLSYGNHPRDLNEIVISNSLANKIGYKYGGEVNTLHILSLVDEIHFNDGKILNKFDGVELKIVGVVNSSRYAIYHYDHWTISFFELLLGISAFDLLVNSISFEVSNVKDIEKTISLLQKGFPTIEFSYPLNEINTSINQICKYVEIALLALSFISITISVLLLTITNYLFAVEAEKDIGLARCIGVSKKQSTKFVYSYSIFGSFIAFITASFELIISKIVILYQSNRDILLTLKGNILISPYVIMLLISLSISFLSSFIISKKMCKKSAIESLKR